MANLELVVPFILKWETGNVIRTGESFEAYYNRCKASRGGITDNPRDSGGYTICGVTLSTYKTYCKVKGLPAATRAGMKQNLTYRVWLDVLENCFCSKCKFNDIASQSVGHSVLDWFWCSGYAGIKAIQRSLNLKPDGIIGPKSLAVLNGNDPKEIFAVIKKSREAYCRNLAARRPKDKVHLRGWLNRINDIEFVG